MSHGITFNNMADAPTFQQIKIPEVQALALGTDQSGYNASDLDFLRRFPLLAQGREVNIADAGNQLAGAQDPLVAQTLDKSGLSANYGNNEYQIAKNQGAPDIVSKEKRDRKYFSRLLSENPQRQFGLSGQDIAHISIANTMGQNNYNQGLFGSRINAYNASIEQNAANNQAYASAAGSIAGDLAKFYRNQQPGYLSSGFYNAPNYGDSGGGHGGLG